MVLHVSTLRRKRHFLRRSQTSRCLLTSHHVYFTAHFAPDIYFASRLSSLGLADLRRQGKVICCLSHEAELSRGEKRGGMNTIAVANINFYFPCSQADIAGFQGNSNLGWREMTLFPSYGRPCPVIRISSEAILVKMWILGKIYGRLENGWANFPRAQMYLILPSVYDTFERVTYENGISIIANKYRMEEFLKLPGINMILEFWYSAWWKAEMRILLKIYDVK